MTTTNIPSIEVLQAIDFFTLKNSINEESVYPYVWADAIRCAHLITTFYNKDLFTLIHTFKEPPNKAYVNFDFNYFTMNEILAIAESMNINKHNIKISIKLYKTIADIVKDYRTVNELKNI